MSSLDPRAKTKITAETINGVITDRAIELIGMLNNAIGAAGQDAGSREVTLIDGNQSSETTVSNYLIAPSSEEAKWKEDQRVYFQATHKRLDQIQEELAQSLDDIKTGLVENVTELFNLLEAKEGNLAAFEQAVIDAQTPDELFAAQEALARETEKVLTSDEALEAMIEIFFESFNLSIEKINNEIFNKLHDFDEDYADGASDIENEKFFYQRAYNLPGEDPLAEKPAIILDSVEDVLAKIIDDQKLIHENIFGAGSYTENMARQHVRNEVEAAFLSDELKLSDEIIAMIIADENLSDEDLHNIKDMKTFLELVSFNQLIEYTGIADRDAAIEQLYKDHLQITVAKYYEDKRTVFDILNGKNNNINSGNTKDLIFSSVHTQLTNVAQGITDLIDNGYSKVANSNLQIAIRKNPFAAIEYLETQRDSVDGIFEELLEEQVNVLIARQRRIMKNYAEDLRQEKREIQASGDIDQARLDEIDNIINEMSAIEYQIRNYDSAQNADTRARLDQLFPHAAIVNFDENILEYSTFTNAMDPEAKYTRAAKLLYVMEDTEAGQKNSEYFTNQLPKPQEDGNIPEDKRPIPPLLYPTPLSAVIGRIGDELMDKSQALINGDSIPTTQWMHDNTQTLMTINEELPNLGASSHGEAFYNSLRENFKTIIKDFFAQNDAAKQVQDQAKTDLQKTLDVQSELTTINGTGFTYGASLTNNLINIQNALNGDIKNNSNLIHRAGLEQTQEYLTNAIDQLDDVNYTQEIALREQEQVPLWQKIQDGTATPEEEARYYELEAQIAQLTIDESNLQRARALLNNPGGIAEFYTNFNASVDNHITNNGGLQEGQTKEDFMNSLQTQNTENFRTAVTAYSDSLTTFENDANNDGESDIVTHFKASLDEVELDIDGNEINDFVDFQNMITNIGALSENITNTFGGKDASEGGISKQSIRRMLLLMFVFSMLEAGEWLQRKDDTNVDRYAITSD